MSIFMNKWFQWLVVMVGVSLIKGIASATLGVSLYPVEGLFALIDERDWASVAYFLIHDIGGLVKGAYLLRAFGIIEFVKGWGEGR